MIALFDHPLDRCIPVALAHTSNPKVVSHLGPKMAKRQKLAPAELADFLEGAAASDSFAAELGLGEASEGHHHSGEVWCGAQRPGARKMFVCIELTINHLFD
eukprot:COSAG02_NODE_9819_length_2100_cov_2.950525_2_plen_102_part_00